MPMLCPARKVATTTLQETAAAQAFPLLVRSVYKADRGPVMHMIRGDSPGLAGQKTGGMPGVGGALAAAANLDQNRLFRARTSDFVAFAQHRP
jgi:hypothetical protein